MVDDKNNLDRRRDIVSHLIFVRLKRLQVFFKRLPTRLLCTQSDYPDNDMDCKKVVFIDLPHAFPTPPSLWRPPTPPSSWAWSRVRPSSWIPSGTTPGISPGVPGQLRSSEAAPQPDHKNILKLKTQLLWHSNEFVKNFTLEKISWLNTVCLHFKSHS